MDSFLADEQAFSRFYRANAETLLIFFTRRTLDPQIALDLVAETFTQAFAGRKGFRGGGDQEASAWLFSIARRQLAAYFDSGRIRRGLRHRLAGGTPLASEADIERIEELASLHDLRAVLRDQLGTLELGQRQALWLRVVEEQPYAVVAAQLGINEAAARARVSRALRALGERLTRTTPTEIGLATAEGSDE